MNNNFSNNPGNRFELLCKKTKFISFIDKVNRFHPQQIIHNDVECTTQIVPVRKYGFFVSLAAGIFLYFTMLCVEMVSNRYAPNDKYLWYYKMAMYVCIYFIWILGIFDLMYKRRIVFNNKGLLVFEARFFIFPKKLITIKVDDVNAYIGLTKGKWQQKMLGMKYEIYLKKRISDGHRLSVIKSSEHKYLLPLFDVFREYLGENAVDTIFSNKDSATSP